MIRISPKLCCLVMLALPGCRNHDDETKNYIRQSEAQWAESVSSNDTSVLHRIMADDCIWVLDGKIMTKAMAIADAGSGPGDFISDHLDSVNIGLFENTAVTQGSETWQRKNKEGGIYKGRFVWTDTWIKRSGQWQIISAEDITVPDSSAR